MRAPDEQGMQHMQGMPEEMTAQCQSAHDEGAMDHAEMMGAQGTGGMMGGPSGHGQGPGATDGGMGGAMMGGRQA